MAIGQLTMQQL